MSFGSLPVPARDAFAVSTAKVQTISKDQAEPGVDRPLMNPLEPPANPSLLRGENYAAQAKEDPEMALCLKTKIRA